MRVAGFPDSLGFLPIWRHPVFSLSHLIQPGECSFPSTHPRIYRHFKRQAERAESGIFTDHFLRAFAEAFPARQAPCQNANPRASWSPYRIDFQGLAAVETQEQWKCFPDLGKYRLLCGCSCTCGKREHREIRRLSL